jgi:hypothetical protein
MGARGNHAPRRLVSTSTATICASAPPHPRRDHPSLPLQGGELNAAVTSALVGIHNQYLGRGPKTASTFHPATCS